MTTKETSYIRIKGNNGRVSAIIQINDCAQLKKYPFLCIDLECNREETCINNNLDCDISYSYLMNIEKRTCTCDMKFCIHCDEEHINDSIDNNVIHCKLCKSCHNDTENYVCTKCKTCHNVFDPDDLIFCIDCTYNTGICHFINYGSPCKKFIYDNKPLYFHKQCDVKIKLNSDLLEDYLELDMIDDPFSKENMEQLYNKYYADI